MRHPWAHGKAAVSSGIRATAYPVGTEMPVLERKPVPGTPLCVLAQGQPALSVTCCSPSFYGLGTPGRVQVWILS